MPKQIEIQSAKLVAKMLYRSMQRMGIFQEQAEIDLLDCVCQLIDETEPPNWQQNVRTFCIDGIPTAKQITYTTLSGKVSLEVVEYNPGRLGRTDYFVRLFQGSKASPIAVFRDQAIATQLYRCIRSRLAIYERQPDFFHSAFQQFP